MKQQLKTQHFAEFNRLKQAVFKAMAINETNIKIEEESKEAVLKQVAYFVPMDYAHKEERGDRILEENQDYLMSEADFRAYHKLVKAEQEKRGLSIPHWNITADYQSRPALRKVENMFIDVCLKMIPQELSEELSEAVKTQYEHRKKFLNINLKLDTSLKCGGQK